MGSAFTLMALGFGGWFLLAAGWTSCILITVLDVYGLGSMLLEWIGVAK